MKMNMKNVVLILLIVMVASFLMAGVLGASIAPFWSGGIFNANVEPYDETREFSADEISSIDVNTISTDINIIPIDEGTDIKVHLYGQVTPDAIPTDFAKVAGSRLTVNARPRPGINTNTRIMLTLDIYVPHGFVETLQSDTVSGDLKVENIDLTKLQFKTVSGKLYTSDMILETVEFKSVSGDMRARGFTADKADFRTTSGNVDITGFGGDIIARSVSGDLIVEFITFNNNISFDTTSGKTRLTLPGDAKFSVRLETVSGKVNSDFPLTVHSSSRNRFEGAVGESDNRIQVKSVSGDVNLNQQ